MAEKGPSAQEIAAAGREFDQAFRPGETPRPADPLEAGALELVAEQFEPKPTRHTALVPVPTESSWEEMLRDLGTQLGTPEKKSGWEVVTSYHPNLFGKTWEKSLGDLAKEAGANTALGVLIRLGVGTAGVNGIPLAVIAGGSIKGIREHYRRVNETWILKRAEKKVDKLNLKDTLAGFFWPEEKKSIALAIGKGATFGLLGNELGSVINQVAEKLPGLTPLAEGVKEAREAVGGKLEGAVGTVKALRGAAPSQVTPPAVADSSDIYNPDSSVWKLQKEGGILGNNIEGNQYHPEIQITDPNAPDWIKDVENTKGDYALAIQKEVGANLSYIDYAIQRAVNNNLIDPALLNDPLKHDMMRNYLQNIMEQHANEVFESHLEEAVKNNWTLDTMVQQGTNDFDNWLGLDQGQIPDELIQGTKDILQTHDLIKDELLKYGAFTPVDNGQSAASMLESVYPGFESMTGLAFKTFQLDGILAANYDRLVESFHNSYPDIPFPVHFGEISYLLELAEKGDLQALARLKGAFAGVSDGNLRISRFTATGGAEILTRILNILHRLG